MNTRDIVGKFINELQLILNGNLPNVDRDVIDDIKADADEALTEILANYKKNAKTIDIRKRYSAEINHISNKLNQLEKGRIYDPKKGNKMDGALDKNIEQIREMLNELFHKIEYNKESATEILGKAMRDTEI